MAIAFAITGAFPKQAVQAPPTLTEQLAAVGVRTLPLRQVQVHKRVVLKQERQGHEISGFLLDCIDVLWRTASLWYLVRIVELGGGTRHVVAYVLSLLALGFSGIALLAAGQSPAWALLFVPPVTAMLAVIYWITAQGSKIGSLRKRWMRTSINRTGTTDQLMGYMPQHLVARVLDARRVPNVVIQLEEFGSDPFIVVAPKWFGGPAVYIGAWATGSEQLDNF